jgi:ribose-phosphate pyrophosphokinase
MLETMGVDHVVSVDLHSAQIEGFFKPQIPVRGGIDSCLLSE